MSVTRVPVDARNLQVVEAGRDIAGADLTGAIVVVKASEVQEDAAAEARLAQRRTADEARGLGALHVVLDPPEVLRRGRPSAGPGSDAPAGWSGLPPEAAVRRWFGERPPRGADAEQVVGEFLDALREAEGGE